MDFKRVWQSKFELLYKEAFELIKTSKRSGELQDEYWKRLSEVADIPHHFRRYLTMLYLNLEIKRRL